MADVCMPVLIKLKTRLSRSNRRISAFPALLALLATCCCAGASPTAAPVPPTTVATKAAEFKALKARVEDTQQDVIRWLLETPALNEHPEETPSHLLSARIEHRFQSVCEAMDTYRQRHSDHSELATIEQPFRQGVTNDLEAIRLWEVARNEAPDSASPWGELAHYFLHSGRVGKAFTCFEKGLLLLPLDTTFYSEFATTLLLYRPDGMRHYKLTEQAIFDKALSVYRLAMRLEPHSFELAVAFAESYYLITPARHAEGQAAWDHALSLAVTEAERGEALIHLARYAVQRSHSNLARIYLAQVNAARWEPLKLALLRRIEDTIKAGKSAVPASPTTEAR